MKVNESIYFLDLKKQYSLIKEEIIEALLKVCESTEFSGGTFVRDFERNFARYCNAKYAAGLNSGTSALHLAMVVLNIKEDDEVIIPANSFISTAWAPAYVNATPVFVDCDPDTWNIDVKDVEERITSKTKAIIGVHLYGQPCDIDELIKIANKYKLFLVEDCAQAAGSKYKGKNIGCFGELGCFSFYPAKNLGAYGDAGAIATNNSIYYEHVKSLRNHGGVRKYYHDQIGYNMRMSDMQAAILNLKLGYLNNWNKRRKEIAEIYSNNIINSKIKLQFQPHWAESNYHLFVVTTEERDKLINYLAENNIYCGLHYPVPCHLQKAFKYLGYEEGSLPNCEYLAKHCISLPMYPELKNREVEIVVKIVNKF